MKKFITKFDTTAELTTFSATTDFGRPHVSLTEDDSKVHYFGDVTHNEPEYVDLGLSVKWATCNLGASSPEQPGKYYAWGETTGYTGEQIESSVRNFTSDEYDNNESKPASGFIGTLDAKYDAATKEFGSNWRIPTADEYQELLDRTTHEWVENYKGSGINGSTFTTWNGAVLFLPATGFASGGIAYMDSNGMYSTSVSANHDVRTVLNMDYRGNMEISDDCGRYLGLSIRPVYVGQ